MTLSDGNKNWWYWRCTPFTSQQPYFAISPEGSYMWATTIVSVSYTYLNNIPLKRKCNGQKDNAGSRTWNEADIHQGCHQLAGAAQNHRTICSPTTFCTKLGEILFGEEVNWMIWQIPVSYAKKHGIIWEMPPIRRRHRNTHAHELLVGATIQCCGHNPKFWRALFKLLRETDYWEWSRRCTAQICHGFCRRRFKQTSSICGVSLSSEKVHWTIRCPPIAA